MVVQGLDRAQAPSAATAKRMLAEIGGRWWNVYIGGPESGGSGWTPALVQEYVRHGIDRFMLTYVGRQSHGPLTRTQGKADALDALAIAKKFGYTGSFPLCLDVELGTFESGPSKTVDYTRAWCAAVRDAGARPGVYANAAPLKAMAKGKVAAEFVWVASWVSHGAAEHDPHAIPNLPAELWAKRGRRAWQYAGAFGGKPCRVLGLDVDISVADLGCLAKPPGDQHVAPTPAAARPAVLRRGDEGVRVERLTRRLSLVRSRVTHAPYLDGARRRFDRETEAAVKAFQRDHDLDDTGRFGRRTGRKLREAVAKHKMRQEAGGVGAGAKAPVGAARRDLEALVARALRTDRRHDTALEDLLTYGLRRKLLLRRLQEQHATSTEGLLSEIVKILREIDADVDRLREMAEQEPALAARGIPGAPGADAPVSKQSIAVGTAVDEYTAPGGQTMTLPVTQMRPLPPSAPEGPASAPNGKATGHGAGPLAGMSERDIARLIREHDESIDAARGVLIERFKRYDEAIARLRPHGGKDGGGKTSKPGGGSGGGEKVAQGKGHGGVVADGSVADIRLGDQAHLVRASKIALARFLAAKGNQEHVELRRALRREARRRKQGEIATRTWEKGVRAAQHLSGRRATGVMDGQLQQRLQRYWPTDSALRRFMRATRAWRLIKGQVSPNFNLREFACKDGTPYVAGLVREQGLSKDQAQRRARELAIRLERVRKAGGDRRLILNSVYRTVAHNAKQPGAAKNSSHLRGFAADMQPPTGVSLETHRQHVRAAFEAGVGFYPRGNFVHGDFDKSLGLNRKWDGP
jgi:hypothetical protein